MKVLPRIKTLLIIACLFGLLKAHCRANSSPENETIQIAVTILPLAEFVEQVGGKYVTVMVMVPPGATPHTHEPTPGQMARLSATQLYVKVGTPIEFELVWLDKLTALNTTMRICNASANIDLLSTGEPAYDNEDHHSYDPHIWLSVRNVHTMIETICRALVSVDPRHEAEYFENANAYRARLDSLDALITAVLTDKNIRMFITYHSAWNYFARDYDLDAKIIEINGKEPSAKTIQHIIETARKFNISIVFASPQFDRRYVNGIAREINGQVILIDPLAKNYIENMGEMACTLAIYLE